MKHRRTLPDAEDGRMAVAAIVMTALKDGTKTARMIATTGRPDDENGLYRRDAFGVLPVLR